MWQIACKIEGSSSKMLQITCSMEGSSSQRLQRTCIFFNRQHNNKHNNNKRNNNKHNKMEGSSSQILQIARKLKGFLRANAANSMLNGRFLRLNAVNSMQNRKFQLQNAANSMQHGRFQLPNAAKNIQNERFQLQNAANSMQHGKGSGRIDVGDGNQTQIRKKITRAGEKIPRRDSAPVFGALIQIIYFFEARSIQIHA